MDCRFDLAEPAAGRRAWLDSHIAGAVFADLGEDLSSPPGPASGRHPLPGRQTLAARLGELGIGQDTQVIAYDQASGAFAARLWWLLRWLGHDAVAVLDGGLDAWRAGGGALQSGATRVQPQRFTIGKTTQPVEDSLAVAAASRSGERLIIDARAPERYSGKVEPIDPIAGHVPGAVNAPFTGNLTPDGHFLPQAMLHQRWTGLLGQRPATGCVAMCGSGVTACHNLLALEVAGFSGAALYAGSWSEWIRDPGRPVARGD